MSKINNFVMRKEVKKMIKEREITLATNTEELLKAIKFTEEILTEAGFGKKKILEIQLAIEEAYMNIITHGYKEKKGSIHISSFAQDDHMVMILEDVGVRFDPTQIDEPALNEDLEERSVGGLGIHLIKSFVEELRYEFVDGKNALTLIIKKE
jgi:anti-sigma regulatory factor (Ser/Thr protein kinase)